VAGPEESSATPGRLSRPHAGPRTLVLVVDGPITPVDIPGLCERVRVLLESSEAEHIHCDVSALTDPDAAAVDALARLQLTAQRLGRRIRLRHACFELQELLALTGLADVVPLCTGCTELPLEPEGQAEQREQTRGIEEEADPADPSA
jgi:ABC-type transporter Mla MlaB component